MIFTIDNDNDIRVHETRGAGRGGRERRRWHHRGPQRKGTGEGGRRVAGQPLGWNSFAGVAPFTDWPVKNFENRDKAVERIWTTIQRLGNSIEPKPAEAAPPAAEKTPRKRKPAKTTKSAPKGKASNGKKAGAGLINRVIGCIRMEEGRRDGRSPQPEIVPKGREVVRYGPSRSRQSVQSSRHARGSDNSTIARLRHVTLRHRGVAAGHAQIGTTTLNLSTLQIHLPVGPLSPCLSLPPE